MYDVQTNHQILSFGDHLMQLFDRGTGNIVVIATRDPETLVWTVHSEGIADVTAPTLAGADQPRSQVITALVDHALLALGGTGYSTLVPHGLPEAS